jgi:hypothetical protein
MFRLRNNVLPTKYSKTIFFLLGLWMGASGSGAAQRSTIDTASAAVNDKEARVADFEEMKYPALAQYAPYRPEGVVVVQATLDHAGNVADAKALSGDFILIPDTLANIRKWHFESNGVKTAIVVYNFRMVRGECRVLSSAFALQRPNFATVVGCLPDLGGWVAIMPAQPRDETVSDINLRVLNFDTDLKYPPLADLGRKEGVVVVQARLGDDGRVEEAVPISGGEMFLPTCIANAKKWRFQPNAQKKTFIVYHFRLVGEDEGKSIFQSPNFVTITATPRQIQ